MSEPIGSYAFLPWLRRGAATQIARRDYDDHPGGATAEPRATMDVRLDFNSGALTAGTSLTLLGPGEVDGLDGRSVIRTWPRADAFDAEPNYFPLLELDQADLPWRYTPAAATTRDRLRPWLVLVVLTADEIDTYTAASPQHPLPVARVTSAASLPDLEQSWAWVHVQVSGRKSVTQAEAATMLASSPHALLARLICPRRLDPRVAYGGYLVPAFERGRLAGLGQAVLDSVDGLTPAWTDGAADIDLPIYYEWKFQTGATGDFESLVRALERRAMPATVGIRPMDVRNPGSGLPPASSTPLGLEGALVSPATQPTLWNPAERTTFLAGLQPLLNRPDDALRSPASGRRIIAPPLYGQWHAARRRLDPSTGRPWFVALNSDPRNRVPAGLGTRVVQAQQQKLMAGAWRQYERIREANERLRLAQLAREASLRVHSRHLHTTDAESFLAITAPVFSRVLGSPQTIRKLIQDSPISNGAMEGQFRRVTRPRGPAGRRAGLAAAGRKTRFFARMNSAGDDRLSPAPPPPVPPNLGTSTDAAKGLVPPWATPRLLALLEQLPLWLRILAIVLLVVGGLLAMQGAFALAAGAAAVAGASFAAAAAIDRRNADLRRRIALRDGTITPQLIGDVPPRPGFTIVTGVRPSAPRGQPEPATPPPAPAQDNQQAMAFRNALSSLHAQLGIAVAPGPVLRPIEIASVVQKIETALDPRTAVATAINARLRLSEAIRRFDDDPIEPVMAAPEFEQPMYEPLRDVSQDFVFPGLDKVPVNTITLLKTNQQFVEAYMVGLSHEMARELLWNEFPTDQRGTHFRQFWDVRGFVPSPGTTVDPQTLKDITPIHTWRNSVLGTSSPHTGTPDRLVLLIRGDLLRRYPTAIVYAVKAQQGATLRELSEPPVERFPLFRGTLNPDVSFFGFSLTEAEVRGTLHSTTDPGWFFVIQEQPAEPRFGLDVAQFPAPNLTSWSDLQWGHLANNTDLQTLRHVDLERARPNTASVHAAAGEPSVVWHASEGTRSSDLAYITLQRPVRIAIHASDMLPETGRGSVSIAAVLAPLRATTVTPAPVAPTPTAPPTPPAPMPPMPMP